MKFNHLGEILSFNAKIRPNKTYIYYEKKKFTYREIDELSNKVAKVFLKFGVTKGDRVCLLLENSPEFIITYFGIAKAGGVAVPLNTYLKEEEIQYIIDNAESKILVTSSRFEDVVKNQKKLCPTLKHIFTYDHSNFESVNMLHLAKAETDLPPNVKITPEDLAVFIYTSGTTGHPKGAMLTHKNLLSNVSACLQVFHIDHTYKVLLALPMFHSYTFTASVLLPTYAGCGIIVLASIMELKKKSFKKILLFQRPNFFLGVPQIYTALARANIPDWFAKFLYPIKIHVSGGAPLPEDIINEFYKKYRKPIIEGYGLSEASPVVAVNPLNKQKPYSVGPALPGIEVKIVNDDEEELPIGEVGELIVKGPNVMKGYWKMEDATALTIRNGWLFTGDLAKIDKDGYIYIVDRKKDLIIVKGINVYPREIEEYLYLYEGIDAAAVIGIPDKQSGEVPVAFIKVKEGSKVDLNALKEYLKKHLANFKVPKHIYIKDDIPMTATGKVLKRKLKEMVLAEMKF
ncbi:MAG: long-chain fatty acid--CoA ligase [Calditerrivibrio nitroreducens]|uniref:Long-chain-fatty-acid--CoA ligase n=1 Tax=Calditerrivibrio nitroreducens TaxID=477976 RepID=A0A2J6WQ39_9BACT|nr:MAG: long-chain fatty acid--CoA ligase [Calditerrivibrio nitroreducens]